MSTPEISRVLAEMRALATRVQGDAEPSVAGAESFGDLLKRSVDAVNSRQQFADQLAQSFEVGETTDLADVMIARQKSSLSFQAMVTVRNRLVEAYKDVWNMPV